MKTKIAIGLLIAILSLLARPTVVTLYNGYKASDKEVDQFCSQTTSGLLQEWCYNQYGREWPKRF